MRGLREVFLLIVVSVLACSCAMAQADLDFLSDVRIKAEESKPAPGVDAAQAMVDELVAAAKDARAAADEARVAATQATVAASDAKKAVADLATNAPVSSPFGGVTIEEVDAAIAKAIADRPAFTESEIREFAKDEIKKHLEAKVKMPDGTVKTVESSTCEVTVNGYEGTFKVPVGGKIVSVDGRPVSSSASMQTANGTVYMGRTSDIQMQTVPMADYSQPQVIRFNSIPQSFGKSMTRQGTCRNVWNAATGRFERRCN